MKTRDERIRYVIRHKDGHFINIRCEPTHDFMKVDRWVTEDDVQAFLHGYYAPPEPDNYYAVPVKVTYELETEESQ
ncbi:hypothetical protein D3C81_1572810 [compost metagenome]